MIYKLPFVLKSLQKSVAQSILSCFKLYIITQYYYVYYAEYVCVVRFSSTLSHYTAKEQIHHSLRHPFYFTNFATLCRQFLVHILKTLLRDTRQLKWNNFKMNLAAKPKKRTSWHSDDLHLPPLSLWGCFSVKILTLSHHDSYSTHPEHLHCCCAASKQIYWDYFTPSLQ